MQRSVEGGTQHLPLASMHAHMDTDIQYTDTKMGTAELEQWL